MFDRFSYLADNLLKGRRLLEAALAAEQASREDCDRRREELLDQEGVGKLIEMAVKAGRAARPPARPPARAVQDGRRRPPPASLGGVAVRFRGQER